MYNSFDDAYVCPNPLVILMSVAHKQNKRLHIEVNTSHEFQLFDHVRVTVCIAFQPSGSPQVS